MSRGSIISLPVMLVLACTRPNPAFEDGGGESVAESFSASGTTSSIETSDSATTVDSQGTLDTTDTDPTTTDTTDTDPTTTDTDPTTTDTDTTDTGDEPCLYPLRQPLRLALRSPLSPCPPSIQSMYVRLDKSTFNFELGMAGGSQCNDIECFNCNPEPNIALGAPGFQPIASLWQALGGLLEPNGIDVLCVQLSVNTPLSFSDGECIYGAMGIRDNTIEHGPVFVGQVDDTPLTWIAQQAIGQEPLVRDTLGSCSCASVFADKPYELMCCEDSGQDLGFHTLSLFGTTLEPGGADAVDILQIPWQFDVLQSQTVPICAPDPLSLHESWALTRMQ